MCVYMYTYIWGVGVGWGGVEYRIYYPRTIYIVVNFLSVIILCAVLCYTVG